MPQFVDAELTYLEMSRAPVQWRPLPRNAQVSRMDRPTVSEYRRLYDTVGEAWHWVDRRLMPDEELMAEIAHPSVDVLILDIDGETAGYAEVDRRRLPDAQLTYFGLFPRFIGRGLGGRFLDAVVEHTWSSPGVERLWLHTCSLDHEAALPMYRRAGFVEYRRETKRQRLLDSPPAR